VDARKARDSAIFYGSLPGSAFFLYQFRGHIQEWGRGSQFSINWHKDPRPWDNILGTGKSFSKIGRLPEGITDFNYYIGDLYPSLVRISYCNTDTVVVRREMADKALHFSENLKWGEDWYCYSQLAKKGLAAYLDFESAWQHGHDGVRLTDTDMLNGIVTRIAIMERIWGADSEYQKKYGQIYKQLLDEQRLKKINELVALGRTLEARADLKLIDSAPLSYKILLALPGGLVRMLLTGRTQLRKR
jgi:hypothetical protein